MLKKLSTSLWLLCFVSAAYAQEDDQKVEETDESKRPSWSAGLPERQKPADLNTPTFKPDRDNEVDLDMSEFGLQQKPELEMELPINSGIDGLAVGNAKEQADQAAAEQAAAEQAAAELAAAEQAAADQAAAEQAAADQAAAEQAAAEQAAAELAAAEQAAADQAAAEQAAADQAAAEQAAADQAAAELAAAELAAAEQAAADQAAAELAAAELAAAELAAAELAAAELAAAELAAAEQAAAELAAAEQAAADQAAAEQAAAEQIENDSISDDTDSVVQEAVALPDEQDESTTEPPISEDFGAVTEAADEQAEYGWNILKRTPVDYPIKAAIDNLEGWVDLEITINPAGEVISASPVNYSRRGRIFGKPAVQSVSNWLFEPPSGFGITNNVTRIYKVEFEL